MNLLDLLAAHPAAAPALRVPGSPACLSYGELRAQSLAMGAILNAAGVGRGDRVALILPTGAALAAAFLGVAGVATACPLSPALRRNELMVAWRRLGVHAVVVTDDGPAEAADLARELGLPLFCVRAASTTTPAAWRLQPVAGNRGPCADACGPALADDIALVLSTSGTTAEPKRVPLTHANLCASATHIRDRMQLTADDRSLSVVPLFHIHGLTAGLLAPLAAGSLVACAAGFNPLYFFVWFADVRPTWFTAVPAMHQMLLARAQHHRALLAAHRLRFVRSSTAPISRQTVAALEAAYDAPLIESYGMTEAAGQIACNPLPPQQRRPGSVGTAAGPQIAIVDAAGRPLAAHTDGEIAICGPNVMRGYLDAPADNQAAFVGEWFRTGDLGRLDDDGYLTISGRLREVINRGGDKVAPGEVDQALLEHPAVAQAVAFPLPSALLGEEVGAAIVLRDPDAATDRELRDFAAQRLADYKVPRKIVIVDRIPQTEAGKVKRGTLASALGLVQT